VRDHSSTWPTWASGCSSRCPATGRRGSSSLNGPVFLPERAICRVWYETAPATMALRVFVDENASAGFIVAL